MKYKDKNKPLVCMMTQSTCYKGTRRFVPKGILWHSTGANNPTLKRYVQPDDNAPDRAEWLAKLGRNEYGNDWNHIVQQAGLNFWIGKLADGTVAAVQTMPWDFRPWGCGSGSKGSCNDTHIQFEICEDALTDTSYFNACYKEACEMTAYLCKMFGIDPKGTISYNGLKVPTIIDHIGSHNLGLGTNHGDIQHWSRRYGKTMADVRNDVAAILAEADSIVSAPDAPATAAPALKKGDSGNAVKTMQTMLIACGFSCGPDGADGDFGKNTLAGLKAFQMAAGLTVSGMYDGKTQAVLEKGYAAVPLTAPAPDKTDEQVIWNRLYAAIQNPYGVAGVMGNFKAESALRANNLQNSYEKKLGMTDEQYTAAVDSGVYTNFVHDSAGYGLYQATYWSIKESLLNYAKAHGNGYAWCDMFVDWCFLTAFGYENALRLLCQPEKSAGAGCTYSLRYYKKKGQFHTSNPKPGDQIFFGTGIDNSTHTGIVEKVDASKVYTVEGNTSDQVARRSYALSNSRILGYGRPAYDNNGPSATPDESAVHAAPTISAESSTQYYRVRKSWSDKASQIGAFTVFQNAKNCVDANPGYAAFDDNGKQMYPVAAFQPYPVKVGISNLNYRKGPGTNYQSWGYIEPGIYTIVDEQNGWGLLKSYAAQRNGWISLAYTARV